MFRKYLSLHNLGNDVFYSYPFVCVDNSKLRSLMIAIISLKPLFKGFIQKVLMLVTGESYKFTGVSVDQNQLLSYSVTSHKYLMNKYS